MNPKRFFFIILFALAVILSQAPLYAATHIVTNCSNEGTGSLRQAILDAQDGDEIVFNITVQEAGYAKKITDLNGYGLVTNEVAGASWFRILLQTDIAINNKNNISIKGSTQPNTESNNPYGPRIEIVRNSFYSPYSAFNLSSSSNCTIEGFAIGGFYNTAGYPAAIKITGGGYNHIYGCYLGVTASGEGTLQAYFSTSYKSNYYGIYISQSIYNTIGGDTVSQRNIISGNQNLGIYITTDSTNNKIKGNYIGTNYLGEKSLENGASGISISGNSHFNSIERNLISGNHGTGIFCYRVDNVYIANNIIGLSLLGVAIPNATGIHLEGSLSAGGKYPIIINNTVSGNKTNGITLYRYTSFEVKGNYIGTDPSGTYAIANGSYGLYLDGSQYGLVGGSILGDQNVISGNTLSGVGLLSANCNSNEVTGNYIGVNKTGDTAIPNGIRGIYFIDYNPKNNIIKENVISGNLQQGILVYQASSNIFSGNYIGTNKNGTTTIPNGMEGIYIAGNNTSRGMSNTIEGNVISGNLQDGIYLYGALSNSIYGNYIGTDKTGNLNLANLYSGIKTTGNSNIIGPNNTIAYNGSNSGNYGIAIDTAFYNTIKENSLFLNYDKGIALINNGNTGIAYPIITSSKYYASTSTTIVQGTAPANATIEVFFTEAVPDLSGQGEGKIYLGKTTSDVNGNWSIELSNPSLNVGSNLCATATSSNGNTSEFSINKETILYVPAGEDTTPPSISISNPNSVTKVKGGVSSNITFIIEDASGIENGTAAFYYKIGSGEWILIAANQSETSPFTWQNIPQITSNQIKIKIEAYDASPSHNLGTGESETFTIDSTAPTVSLVQPNGGESLTSNTVYSVQWTAEDIQFTPSENILINLYYSLNEGADWTPMPSGTGISNTGSLSWAVPDVETNEAKVKIEAIDNVGNINTEESSNFTIKSNIAPLVQILSPLSSAKWKGGTVQSITYTAQDSSGLKLNSASIYYSTGETWIQIATNQPVFSATNTSYSWTVPIISTLEAKIRVTAEDIYGNIGTGETPSFLIDGQGPDAPILRSPANGTLTNDNSPELRWDAPSISDISGISTYTIYLNQSLFAAVNGNTTSYALPSPLSDGEYSWEIRATDGVGNVGNLSDKWIFTIDTTPPSVPILNTPSDGSTINDPNVSFTWEASVDNLSLVAGYEMVIDNAVTPVSVATNSYQSNMANGTHTWKVRAQDTLGNISNYSDEWTFTIDNLPPTIDSITLKDRTSTSTQYSNEQTISVEANGVAGDPAYMKMARTDAALIAAAWIPYSQKFEYTFSTGDGTKTLLYKLKDSFNNESGTVQNSIIVDTTPPSVPILNTPIDGSITNDPDVLFTWEASVDNLSGVAGYEIIIDNAVTPISVATNSYQSNMANGVHTWKVRAQDALGNISGYSDEWTFVVDNLPPTIDSITLKDRTSANTQYSNEQTISVEANGVAGDPAYMKMARTDAELISATWKPYSQNLEYTFSTGDGTKTLLYKLKDSLNNESNTVQNSIIVDTTPPTIVIYNPILNEEITGGTNYQIKWQANDEIFNIPGTLAINVYYSLNNGIDWSLLLTSNTNNSTFNWNPVPNQATTTAKIRVEAIDGVQNIATAESGNFTIKKDEGYVPTGPLTLSIQRENDSIGSAIKVLWQETGEEIIPDFYILTGTGSGSYVEDPNNWTQISSYGGDFKIDYTNNYLTHQNQVRAGEVEVYYKALYTGTPLADLASAVAVGKVNISLEASSSYAKLALISLPLIPNDTSIANVLGNQFEGAEGNDFTSADYIYYLEPGENSPQSFYNGIAWQGKLTDIYPDKGYVFITQGGHPARTITVVGAVAQESRVISIKRKSYTGLNLLGTAYPVSVFLQPDNTGLSGTSPKEGTGFDNADYIYTFETNSAPQAFYNGSNWSGKLNKLKIGKGYVYIKQVDGEVNWTYPKQY